MRYRAKFWILVLSLFVVVLKKADSYIDPGTGGIITSNILNIMRGIIIFTTGIIFTKIIKPIKRFILESS